MITGLYSPTSKKTKLGRVATVNRPAGTTCPGASEWCARDCYAKHGLFRTFGHQARYGAATLTLPAKLPPVVRLHVSGDFDTVEYVRLWIEKVKANPDTLFWAYTRSWNVPELLPELEALRVLPNMQLFASVDPTMPEPPKGWRIAHVADSRFRGMECLEQNGKMPDCETCGYCFWKGKGNVEFNLH
jgi:hypothetical protein|tara:strand:- start:251 stop:811 length:561 start_codon:yes stop_codon:yes gene_type:complete